MPSDAELGKLLDIVAGAYPGEFRHDLEEFRRAFFACGRLGRLPEPSTDRYFVSSLDDANEILRARRLGSIDGGMLFAAAIAWGDVSFRGCRQGPGQSLEVSLARPNTGSPAVPRWREILKGVPLQAPLPPRGMRGASYATPNVKIYRESADGAMREADPTRNLWTQ